MTGTVEPDWHAIATFESNLIEQYADRGAVRSEHVVAFDPPFRFHAWLGTTSDAERDLLSADPGLYRVAQRLAAAAGLEGLLSSVIVESQETVDRDYAASWSYRLR
ncbi:hypothetical protein [Aeromicrobium sp. IC_218]|uniref:hypothetical protein n=1 Tax=Aeromicrobium sp. IC_218 TaxID=2545468 RepID=UPI00103FE934|nr:hypothetical protein [Aeromicrobium sp. IC_218]TCJ00098.1 hypothetical protein E0W78_02515 [Aeromicrobium sp. IC_218]